MEILRFEFVDLGAAPADTVYPGDSFRNEFDAEVIGTGASARLAMKAALDELALDGYDTRLVHEAAIEAGWHGQDAEESATNLYEPAEDEDMTNVVVEYHVLIRFMDPKIAD